jgi:putative metalloenzyme radical SAM/SPASM domain maturase
MKKTSLLTSPAKQLMAASPPLRNHPAKLYVETTTRCNLACPMCVKQTREKGETEGLLASAVFEQVLPAVPHLDALILNGIGEPLLHPGLETFITTAKKRMPTEGWIGFQTNGLLIDDVRAQSLVASGLDKICISVDAVDPGIYRSLRSGGEFKRIERTFSALMAAKKNAGSSLQIGIEFVAMRENLAGLPGVLRWAAGRGASFAIVTHLLPYHEAMVPHALFDANTDNAVALFRHWKEKAIRKGIDIYRYPAVYLKYGKTPEEWKIFDAVEAMKAEAVSKNTFLHLDKLFKMGDVMAQEVARVFEEARAAAAESGMDIRLPEAVPKSGRICEFVEEGASFISWDGNVHPCYFLWHRYQCYIDDHKKSVQPRVFGNLRKQGILEIWNLPAYLTFRQNVVRYDYPFCFNCGFALCDYVEGADFHQDCYVNTEPCGACLWCQGVFHCLR